MRHGEDDVRRHQPLVAGVVSAEERNHRPDPRIDLPIARHAARLRGVRRCFVGKDAVRHAADDRILVGLLGQVGQQFADADAGHVRGDGLVQGTAIIGARGRFGVEGVEVRRPAPHPDLDHRFGLGLGTGGLFRGQARQVELAADHQAGGRPPTSGKPLRDAKTVPRRSSMDPCCSWVYSLGGVGQARFQCAPAHQPKKLVGRRCATMPRTVPRSGPTLILMPIHELRAIDQGPGEIDDGLATGLLAGIQIPQGDLRFVIRGETREDASDTSSRSTAAAIRGWCPLPAPAAPGSAGFAPVSAECASNSTCAAAAPR